MLTPPSAICTARAPCGSPWNLFFVSVTCVITSNIVSARILRIAAREKFFTSASFDFVGCVDRWYACDVQMSRTSFLKSYR